MSSPVCALLSVLSCVCSPLCSHMCALICVLSSLCTHMCAPICVPLICLLLCALICVSSSSSSPLVSYPLAPPHTLWGLDCRDYSVFTVFRWVSFGFHVHHPHVPCRWTIRRAFSVSLISCWLKESMILQFSGGPLKRNR